MKIGECFRLNSALRDVFEEWGEDRFIIDTSDGEVINSDQDMVLTLLASHHERVKTHVPMRIRLGLLSNGDMVTFSETSEEAGLTFTGDRNIKSYRKIYTIKEKVLESELYKDWMDLDNVSYERVESVAVEIAQAIGDLYDSGKFYV